MNTTMQNVLISAYLDFRNNYLTVALWAEHNGMSVKDADTVLKLGHKLHEENVQLYKSLTKGA